MLDSLRRLFVRATSVANHQAVLDSAIGLKMINNVEGDYLEFGVFRGDRITQAYETATFISKQIRTGSDPYLAKANVGPLDEMRFFGFDSFEGLPQANTIDVVEGQEEWIGKGGFAATLDEVTKLLPRKGIESGRIKLVKGWFNETLTEQTKKNLDLKAAAIVYIDSDFYESAVPALEFVTDLLVDGSILIFDDWWIFKGRKDRGEQRAFHEWQEKHKIEAREFIPGTAMSFMINR